MRLADVPESSPPLAMLLSTSPVVGAVSMLRSVQTPPRRLAGTRVYSAHHAVIVSRKSFLRRIGRAADVGGMHNAYPLSARGGSNERFPLHAIPARELGRHNAPQLDLVGLV